VSRVTSGLAYEERGKREAEAGVRDSEEERLGSQARMLGDEAGRERRDRDGDVVR
jgi:hypothetical protein